MNRTATVRRLTVAAQTAVTLLPLTDAGFAPRNTAAFAASLVDDDTSAVEKATESRVVPMTVFAGASRSTSETAIAKFSEALGKIAAGAKGQLTGETEVLAWKKEDGAKRKMPILMKVEGLRYEEQGKTKLDGTTDVTVFTVTRAKDNIRVLGFWVETDEVSLLAWSGVEKAEGGDAASAKPTRNILPDTDDKPTPKPAAYSGKGVPAELLGAEWRWTTINGHYFVDERTGQYAGDGGGMAVHFTFLKNGRYKKFFFVKMRPTAGLGSQSTTTEEGTITFNPEGAFVLHPDKGWYKGIDMGGKVIDRPMKPEECKAATYRWKWETTNGERRLMISPGPEAQYSWFRRN